MELIPDFKQKFPKLWSVRLGVVAAVLSGLETILPLFETAIPRGVFAGLSFIAVVAAVIARGVAQKDINGTVE